MLDSKSLGGDDHRKPLFRTELVCNEDVDFAGRGVWGSLSTWEDAKGTRWIFAPVWGPLHPNFKFPATNGDAPNGSIVAFKVEDKDGKTVLTPAWVSRDLIAPAPPVGGNGVVFALSSGEFVRQARENKGGLFSPEERAQILLMPSFMRSTLRPEKNYGQAEIASRHSHTLPEWLLRMAAYTWHLRQHAVLLRLPYGALRVYRKFRLGRAALTQNHPASLQRPSSLVRTRHARRQLHDFDIAKMDLGSFGFQTDASPSFATSG